jgi:hypothetical protein
MEGCRYVLFVKLWDCPIWVEHVAFFTAEGADAYGRTLQAIFPQIETYHISPRPTAATEVSTPEKFR